MFRPILRAYRDAYGGLSTEVWTLSIAMFINRSGSMVLAFLTLYLTNRLGFSMSQAGAIFSVFGIGSIVGAWLGGLLIRVLGAIRLQIVCMILGMPLFFLVPCFESWTGVAVSIFFLSTCTEAVRPANHVAIAQFAQESKLTRAYGLHRMAINLGFSIGPAIGGWLAQVSFVWLFVVDGITTALGGLYLLSHFGFRRYAKNSAAAKQQQLAESVRNEGSPLQDARFLFFLFLMLLVTLVFHQFVAIYPKYAQDHYGMSKPQIGLLYAVNTVMIVVLEMLVVNLVRDFNLLRTIGVGAFFACLGFGILPYSSATWFIVFAMMVTTAGEMLMFPLASGFVARRSTGRDQAAYMSWYAMNFSLGAVLAPMIGSLVYEYDRDLYWYISTVIGAVVLLGFVLMARRNATTDTNPGRPGSTSITGTSE